MYRNFSPSIVDIEASGFGPESYPIEIGIVKGTGQRYCALIKPSEHWTHWCHAAESLHGIPRDTIIGQGKSPILVCEELNAFLHGEQVYSDAWVHDARWLNKLFEYSGIQPAFRLTAIEFILKEKQHDIWDEVKQRVGKQLKVQRHRASSDAFWVQQTYIQSRFDCV